MILNSKAFISGPALLSKNCFCFIFFLFCFNQLKSQVRMEATGYDHKGDATGYYFYGMAILPNKDRIPFTRIKGSPFWKDNWQVATLYSDTMKLFTMPVRLNLATNEIHFLRDEKEFVLETGDISTIVFHPDNDISKTTEIFIMNDPFLFLSGKKVEGFVKVMNNGNYRLLKYTHRIVSSADSLFGTQKKYFFTDEVFYYMWFNEKIERIKKLNKDNILKFLPSSSSYTKWSGQNEIDLKKEEDVIRFLDHYNVTQLNKKADNNGK